MVFVDLAQCFRISGVDCRDDGEIVLVLVEVVWRESVGVVEWVGEALIERSKGEFVNVVGEVECWQWC